MSFKIKDNHVLNKHNEIWDKIKKSLNIKFHNMPVYDEKHVKDKVKEFNGTIKTNFLGDKILKKKACITLALPVSLLILL